MADWRYTRRESHTTTKTDGQSGITTGKAHRRVRWAMLPILRDYGICAVLPNASSWEARGDCCDQCGAHGTACYGRGFERVTCRSAISALRFQLCNLARAVAFPLTCTR